MNFLLEILRALTLSSMVSIVMFLVYFCTAVLITDMFRLNYSKNYNGNLILSLILVLSLSTYFISFIYFLKF